MGRFPCVKRPCAKVTASPLPLLPHSPQPTFSGKPIDMLRCRKAHLCSFPFVRCTCMIIMSFHFQSLTFHFGIRVTLERSMYGGCEWRPPVHKDHVCFHQRVVALNGFYCISGIIRMSQGLLQNCSCIELSYSSPGDIFSFFAFVKNFAKDHVSSFTGWKRTSTWELPFLLVCLKTHKNIDGDL